MPDIQANLEFLANLPLYETEKPYLALVPPRPDFDPDTERMDNLEWETHTDITITDIRGQIDILTIDKCGFQVMQHSTGVKEFDGVKDLRAYREETEALLRDTLQASYVLCYDLKLRKNAAFQREVIDLNDPFLVEGPAKGAHNDVTSTSGPQIIRRYLSLEDQKRFLRPGYRIRIVNTWRPLVPVLEDCPLALCDYRSVDPEDFLEADRVFPDRVGEVYYLKYSKKHHWFWLEGQKQSEPFVFIMYDTMVGDQAKFCPHVSFHNPRASPHSIPRRSVETRSIVISKL